MEDGEAHADTPLGGVVPPKDIAPCDDVESAQFPSFVAFRKGPGFTVPGQPNDSMPDVLKRPIAWHDNWRRKGRTEDDENPSEFKEVVPLEDIAPCLGSTLESTVDPDVTAPETGEGDANPDEEKDDVYFTNDEYGHDLSIGDLRRSAFLNGTVLVGLHFSRVVPRFLSNFWKEVSTKISVQLLTSTAYHAQTDGQSERTNQTVEIALRYFVTSNLDRH
ncbi:hypothetical protein W97_05035 [Coniosporium apollinis CBS 100218]|uniref:Integrase catalytic domain-containing protein n=1 Tax=Coniosporium apollinis (strain CBS 100218) TaxID=1168221 RepID=R7YVV4_CONA1|nr:uncharacterized protein W97_05035 [Coniosporium apollinis CBS 100218]EON65796.1 hypothetical protein W97_05035 [Coniosporium apollinis CBS 100218]